MAEAEDSRHDLLRFLAHPQGAPTSPRSGNRTDRARLLPLGPPGMYGRSLISYSCPSRVVQEAILLALRLPSARKKVETELGKARLDIEKKMVPQGPNVTRHLSLPTEGRDQDWILAEMAKMDEEGGHHVNWEDGRVSGAVYRKY